MPPSSVRTPTPITEAVRKGLSYAVGHLNAIAEDMGTPDDPEGCYPADQIEAMHTAIEWIEAVLQSRSRRAA